MSEHFTAAHADIQWEANTGKTTAEVLELGQVWHRTTGAMSDEALRLAIAQEKVNKAVQRSGPESTAAKQATLAYRREVTALSASQTQAVHASTRHAGVLDKEERSLGRVARGALAGSGAIRGFGRSVAFASGAFLGGAGLLYAIESTVKAAENSDKVLGQTENAVKRVGLSWDQYGEQIRKAALEQSHVSGFDDERLLGTFSKFVRQTKDVNEALRLNALASNVARGADIELEQAAKIVLRAHVGQARGLAVLGIEARKGATGVELINQITQKYANSAQAYGDKAVGAQDRIRVAIENTQEVVAKDYLPTIAKQLNQGADWLNQAKNQERIQRDVNEAVNAAVGVVHGLHHAYDEIAPALRLVVQLLGGAKGATEFLLAVYTGAKVRNALIALGLLKAGTLGIGTAAVAAEAQTAAAMTGIVASERAAAAGGVGAAGALGLLLTKARAIGALGTVTLAFRFPGLAAGLAGLAGIPATVAALATLGPILSSGAAPNVPGFASEGQKGRITQAVAQLATEGKIPADVLKQIAGLYGIKTDKPAGIAFKDNPEFVQALYQWAVAHGLTGTPAGGAGSEAAAKAAHGRNVPAGTTPRADAKPPKPKPLDRLTRINLAVSQAQTAVSRGDKGAQQQLIAALKEQIDYDRDYEAKQEQLIKTDPAHRKQHATILQGLYADEQSARDQIQSIEDANSQKAKDAATKAARARAKAKSEREAAERKRAKDYRDGLALREQRLKNDVAAAKLTENTLADDKAAYAKLIAFDKAQEHNTKLTAREQENYHAKELAARKALADVGKTKATSTANLFEEAAAEFKMYGSNIAQQRGEALSGQDARGLLGQIILAVKEVGRHTGGTEAHAGTIARNSRTGIDDARLAARNGL